MISALLRLDLIEGFVFIDEIDTQILGLTDLRKKISIIPQEPVLFSATLRYNLDPFEEFKDDQIWRALEDVSSISPQYFHCLRLLVIFLKLNIIIFLKIKFIKEVPLNDC